MLGRKAAAFWVDPGPRTTLSAFKHDVVVDGPPVRSHPIRLKGTDATFVAESLDQEVKDGLYVRGASAWGSWAFPTQPGPAGRRRRIVVDYRRVNTRIVRSIYYIRRCDDIKQELIGSAFLSTFDGLKGFNLLENTPFASEVLAVLAELGCFLYGLAAQPNQRAV